ncbi:MAG TPA: RNA polymerase sigma factor, partial [Streptosporangiaceae bacterium]|nr:RNA polymerase sigma factor [Streptosporangiaceae bacterium]
RGGVSVAALLTVPPAPVLPAALRHRVMHTGTDTELAGYRADIAARGGALTAEGMPRQPDVASPVARRWIFTGSAVAGALATALVAILLIGPGLSTLDLALPRWPMQLVGPENKAPSGHSAKHSSGPRTSRGGQDGGGTGGQQTPPAPQSIGHLPSTAKPGPAATTVPAGTLKLSATAVQIPYTNSAELDLGAARGPVTWSAISSSDQLTLNSLGSTIVRDKTYKLMISFKPTLLQLPSSAMITFTDRASHVQQVTVSWGLYLL